MKDLEYISDDDPPSPIPTLRVSPIGLVEYPDDFTPAARQLGPVLRWATWAMLIFFTTATVATSIISLGAYCLTSDGADTRALHAGPVMSKARSTPEQSSPSD